MSCQLKGTSGKSDARNEGDLPSSSHSRRSSSIGNVEEEKRCIQGSLIHDLLEWLSGENFSRMGRSMSFAQQTDLYLNELIDTLANLIF